MVPDLKVWRNVAVMLLFFSLYMAYRLNASLAQHVFDVYKSRITAMHHAGKDTVQVLFLGTSLTKYALGPSESGLIRRLESVMKQPVRLERMVINSVNADLLLQNDLPAHINRYFPDYVFLEGNMFMKAAEEKDKVAWERDFTVFYLTKYPLSLLYPSQATMRNIMDNLQNEFLKEYHTGEQALSRSGALQERKYAPVATIDAWKDALNMLSKNTSVVLLHYPLTGVPAAYSRQLGDVLEDLGQQVPEAVWKLPDSLITEQFFVDGAHLSRIGTDRFLDWMILKLSALHDEVN